MFYFHYNYIREKYGDKAELFFTDTDSLMYEIQTKDFYQDISKDIQKKFDILIIKWKKLESEDSFEKVADELIEEQKNKFIRKTKG